MLSKILFFVIGLFSNVHLLYTVNDLILFLSTQKMRANDLDASTLTLITVDVCLVVLFMAQHSGLATSVYRDVMKFFYLQPITRAVYTLLTSLALQFMMSRWQTIGEVQFWYLDTSDQPLLWMFFHILHWVLWILTFLQVLFMMSKWQTIGEVQFWYLDTSDQPLLWMFFHILHWVLWFLTFLQVLFMMGRWQTIGEVQFWYLDTSDQPLLWMFFHILHWVLWILTFLQVLVMAPLELTGLKQIWNFIRDVYPMETRFQQVLRHLPHPGSGCFIAILWIHPCMTFDRMILATVLTAYLWTGFSVTKGDYSFLKSYTSFTQTRSTQRVLRSQRRR